MILAMLHPVRSRTVFLTALVALASCGGGGGTTPAPAPTCQPGAAAYALFTDPMTQPAAGAAGVSTTIGSITVPAMDHVAGATLQLLQQTGGPIQAGIFTASGTSSLTATVPKLQPNTTYHTFAVGVPCGPDFDFGQFTTGAT